MPGLYSLRKLGGLRVVGGKLEQVFEEPTTIERGRTWGARVAPLPVVQPRKFSSESIRSESCSQHERSKQVTDPIGQSVKARIFQSEHLERYGSDMSASSGSEHEPNSVCLAAMVHNFFEDDDYERRLLRARACYICGGVSGCSCFSDDEDGHSDGELARILQRLSQCSDAGETMLFANVTRALTHAKEDHTICKGNITNCSGSCVRRAVMTCLRSAGYDAAICKSRWDHSQSYPGGDYEYIDVVSSTRHHQRRVIVDINFRAQFQMARPTRRYMQAVQMLPLVFVGRAERVQQLVDLMTESCQRSLDKRCMHLPPWRKPAYMRAKWLAPYKRTHNEVPSSGYDYGGCSERIHSLQPSSTTTTIPSSSRRSTAAAAGAVEVAAPEWGYNGRLLLPSPPQHGDWGPDVDVVVAQRGGKVFPLAVKECRHHHPVGTTGKAAGGGRRHHTKTQQQQQQQQASAVGLAGDSTYIENSAWQLPSVEPKAGGASSLPKRAGLASLLREAGLLPSLHRDASSHM
eukprot:jgi/Mesen1/6016/ME000306S05276